MKKLIITNGTGGSGKDTFCKLVVDYLGENFNSVRYSYVDFARQTLADAESFSRMTGDIVKFSLRSQIWIKS